MSDRSYNPIGILSNFHLKLIALITMTIDHVGMMFFPRYDIFRIIGRLSFPIFAFLIAEGCSYTRNKLKRSLMIFGMGLIYLLVYYIYDGQLYGSIFMTFSFSIFFIFLLMDIKKMLFNKKYIIFSLLLILFGGLIYLTHLLNEVLYIDYGLFGILLPVFISLFDFRNTNAPKILKRLDCIWIKMLCMTGGLFLLAHFRPMMGLQSYCLFSIVFIALYNGKVGYKGLKYGFYAYYPIHLLIIEGVNILL